jgi:CRP-like cAMP-binding protein
LADRARDRPRRYPAGSSVWTPDRVADRLFGLLSGRVQITSVEANGRERLLRTIEPGDTFGELCFCSHRDEPCGTTAQALASSTVIEISYEIFSTLLRRNPGLMTRVVGMFCIRLAEAEERARILAFHDAKQRLGWLLLHVASVRGRPNATGTTAVLSTSHAELASLGALSRAHVSVTMVGLRRRGLVSYRRGSPLTVNVARLRAALEAQQD